MAVDILIILNNFFHDLASAMWFCGTLTLLGIVREGEKIEGTETRAFSKALFFRIRKVTNWSLVFVLLGGVVRAINYQKYEWLPALGRGQVGLLLVKHALLFVIVAVALILQVKLAKKIKAL